MSIALIGFHRGTHGTTAKCICGHIFTWDHPSHVPIEIRKKIHFIDRHPRRYALKRIL